MVQKWVYNLADNRFLYGGFTEPPLVGAGQGLCALAEDVIIDLVLDRFDSTSSTLRRQATAAELQTAATAQADADAQASIDTQKAIKAAVITSLWGRLNRQPTAAEISAERTRFVNILKAL